jgi:hypothetical protein
MTLDTVFDGNSGCSIMHILMTFKLFFLYCGLPDVCFRGSLMFALVFEVCDDGFLQKFAWKFLGKG